MNRHLPTLFAATAMFVHLLPAGSAMAQTQVGNYASHATSGRSVVITGATGESLRYVHKDLGVLIGAAQGTFSGAPTARSYSVIYHGLSESVPLFLNGTSLKSYATEAAIPATEDGTTWDATKKLLIVRVASKPVTGTVWIANSASATGPGDGIPDGGAGGGAGSSGTGSDAGAGGAGGSGSKGGSSGGAAGGTTSTAGDVGGTSSSRGSVTSSGRGGSGGGGSGGGVGASGGASGGGPGTSAAAVSAGASGGSQGPLTSTSSAVSAESKSSGGSCEMGGRARQANLLALALFLTAAVGLRRRSAHEG